MIKKLIRTLKVVTCVFLIAQLSGCGTIMYPQRRGQTGGKVDAGVAVLDGVGLLLFLVPGVVAFIVDFSTGAIYLPGTYMSSLNQKNMKVVKFNPNNYTNETLEKIVKQETGFDVKLNDASTKVTKLESIDGVNINLVKAFDKDRN